MDKKEEIIFAMGELFSQVGYNASIADLAKAVGLKPSSIYSHYESKDQIIMKLFELEAKVFFELFEKELLSLKSLSCEDSLKKLYFFFFDYYKGNSKATLWLHAAHIPNDELRNSCMSLKYENDKKIGAVIDEIFKEGIKNKEIKSENLEGSIRLYNTTISGNIITLGFENQEIEVLNKIIGTIWDAYWQAIKK